MEGVEGGSGGMPFAVCLIFAIVDCYLLGFDINMS